MRPRHSSAALSGQVARPLYRRVDRLVWLGTVLLALSYATPSVGQYMYLDANGDGIHTPADIVSSSGVTLVDVWIKTDSARDGTPASCSAADSSLTIRFYFSFRTWRSGKARLSISSSQRPTSTVTR